MLKFAGFKGWTIVRWFSVFLIIGLLLSYNPASVYGQDNTTPAPVSDIDAQIAKIDQEVAGVNVDLDDADNLKGTLQEQQQAVQDQINQTEGIITESKQLVNQIQDQIDANQKQYDDLVSQMKSVLFEIEKESKTPLFLRILSSENLADALSKTYSYTLLQNKAETLIQDIQTTQSKLQDSQDKEKTTQAQLDNIDFLLKSKKSGLDDLINTYINKESDYENMVKTLSAQRQANEAEVAAVEGGSVSTTSGCFFQETTPLDIPKDYLGKPADGAISRVFDGCRHDAADIANSIGTHLYAVADGVVFKKGYEAGGYGNYIFIKHTLPSGQRVYALYGHMNSQSPLNVGDLVTKGTLVGYMGSTGFSTGPHVHFALFSESFEQNGNNIGCRNGGKTHSYCYDPTQYITF
jgi:murein DD-endopeptidase MepM/ murein hydrolase activator NlpD